MHQVLLCLTAVAAVAFVGAAVGGSCWDVATAADLGASEQPIVILVRAKDVNLGRRNRIFQYERTLKFRLDKENP
jgi:hypothetical protein